MEEPGGLYSPQGHKELDITEQCHFLSGAPQVALVVKESESEVAQSCLTLCDPMDCSLPGSSVHGIFQARILEWVTISLSKVSSQPRDQTQVTCIAGSRFTI